jgi:hypothetical protein
MGYLVRLDTIKMESLTIGQEYKTATSVTFGSTDAFVYDAEGEVFYALGYKYDGKTYYSIADLEAGGVVVVNPSNENPSEEPQPSEEPEPEPVDPSLLAGVNIPVLGTGMTEVYWNGTTEVVRGDTGFDVTKWYNYIAQAGSTAYGGTSKWANAKLNGSYFVWIPRFAYKIISAGNIDVLFMYGTSSTKYIDRATNTAMDLPTGYIIHPAFISDISKGGWNSELSGIWVAKFEASRSDATNISNGSSSLLKSIPDVKTCGANIGDSYLLSKNYNSTLNSHMLKNSEWAAVAYLTQSKYGRNNTEITINNNSNSLTGYAGGSVSAASSTIDTYFYNTPQGVLASTTGNIYGIYDLSGCCNEFVASYNSASTYTSSLDYGKSFVYLNGTSSPVDMVGTKFATAYSTSSITGDAITETRYWNGDSGGVFISSNSPYYLRGGSYGLAAGAGIFCFSTANGRQGANLTSFRFSLAF